jgi:hypothetical protein
MGPLVWHVTVRATGADAGAVGVVDRVLELDKHVVAHFMAGHAECLGIGRLQGGVEAAPENDTGDKAPKCQETQAVIQARTTQDAPVALSKANSAFMLPP